MVQPVPTKLCEEKRRQYEERFPHFKNIKAHCFNWPNGEPTVFFVREGGQDSEHSAQIQNVQLRLWPAGYEINTWTEEIVEDPATTTSNNVVTAKT
jgi:hypothetical protein